MSSEANPPMSVPPIPVRPAIANLRPYVPGKPIAEVQRELGLVDVVKLASNENPLGPSPKARQAMVEAVQEGHIYPESTAPTVKAALARQLGVPAEEIFIGNGSDEILRLLCATYIEPGDRVVVPAPSFPTYANAAKLMGAEVSVVPLRNFAMDLPAMAAAVKGGPGQAPAKIVFLCRPNNPTGTVFAEADFKAFLGEVGPRVLVVVDEAYKEYDTSAFDSLGLLHAYPQVVLTRTFSKIYGLGGLRIGYGIAHPAIWQPLYAVREPFTINSLAQAAALAALGDHEHVERSLAVNAAGKARLYRLCDELGLAYVPSEGNFVLVDLGRPAQPVYEAMLRQGVIVRPGFGLPNHVRITLGTEAEMDRLEAALRKALA
jgi:histidinol-phosphate aminotransferase